MAELPLIKMTSLETDNLAKYLILGQLNEIKFRRVKVFTLVTIG
jgi:hypothetical protein